MSDTLTQSEMRRLYDRGCPVVRYSKLHNLHCDYSFKDSGVSKAGAMLGACHDLAREIWGQGAYIYRNLGTVCTAGVGHDKKGEYVILANAPSLHRAFVALWHKMKDKQEQQEPSEPDKNESMTPSHDELLAECVKLFPNQEWSLRRTTFADGRSCVTLCDGDPNRVGMIFHACSKGETNADLAQAWIWLKERKDAIHG